VQTLDPANPEASNILTRQLNRALADINPFFPHVPATDTSARWIEQFRQMVENINLALASSLTIANAVLACRMGPRLRTATPYPEGWDGPFVAHNEYISGWGTLA